MKKIFRIYFWCGVSYFILLLMSLLITCTDYKTPDFKFGLGVAFFYTIFLYSPIVTILAYCFDRYGICHKIFNNFYCAILYSIYPVLTIKLIDFCLDKIGIFWGAMVSDYCYFGIILVVNVFILLQAVIRHRLK